MFLFPALPGAAHLFQVSRVIVAWKEDGVYGLPPCPGFTGDVLRSAGLGSSVSLLTASPAAARGFPTRSVAYTTHLTTSTGVASHELKAIFDLPSLSLPLASYLLYYGCLTSLREGPLPWAKQLFSCGISR